MLKEILKDWWFYFALLVILTIGCIFESSLADIGTVTRGNPAVYEDGVFKMRPSSFNFTGGGVSVSSSPSGVTITISGSTDAATTSMVNSTLTYILEANASAYININDTTQTKTGGLNIGGNVGIGTTNPAYQLEMVQFSGSRLRLFDSQSGDNIALRNDGSALDLEANNDDLFISANTNKNIYMNATNSGNIGIGTLGPRQKLEVSGSQVITGNLGLGTATPSSKLDVFGGSITVRGTNSGIAISTNFVVQVGGNVGVGTINPTNKLQVDDGTVLVKQTSNDAAIYMDAGGGAYGRIQATNAAGDTPINLALVPFGGNVGVGTTAPTGKLDIVGGGIRAASMTYTGLATLATGSNGMFYYDTTLNKFRCYENGGWINCSSGTSQWITNGTSIYYPTGNVGISTGTPFKQLEIKGSGNRPMLMISDSNGFRGGLQYNSVNGMQMRTNVYRDDAGTDIVPITNKSSWDIINGNGDGVDDIFLIRRSSTGTSTPSFSSFFVVNNAGNVGIGTASPRKRLHLYDGLGLNNDSITIGDGINFGVGVSTFSVQHSSFQLDLGGNFNTGYNMVSGTAPVAKLYIHNYSNDEAGPPLYPIYVEDENSTQNPDFFLKAGNSGTNANSMMYVAGNVGIGTTNPREKLDVTGGNMETNRYLQVRAWDDDSVNYGTGSAQVWYRGTGGSSPHMANSLIVNTGHNFMVRTGNVGIGTTNPTEKLEVTGRIMLSTNHSDRLSGRDTVGNRLDMLFIDNTNRIVQRFPSTGTYTMQNGGGIDLIAVSNGGNVGIGTISPNKKLHLSVGNVDGIKIQSTNSGNIDFVTTADSSANPRNWRIAPQWTADGNFEILSSTGKGVEVLPTTTRVAIDVNGSVGIGTASPAYKLDISGGGLRTLNTGESFLGTDAGRNLEMRASNSTVYIDMSTSSVGDLNWRLITQTGASPRFDVFNGAGLTPMSLSYGGNVGIGTTNPTNKLTVSGGLTLTNVTGTYEAGVLGYTDSNWGFIYRPPVAGAIAAHLFEAYDGANLMTIVNNGNVGIGTVVPVRLFQVRDDIRVGAGTTGCVEDGDGTVIAGTCSSDERFKTVVGTMAMVVSSFTMLEPKYYHWKIGEYPTEGWGIEKQLGLIAQDVEPIIPELVFTDDKGYKKVRYEQLPMYFLKSMKEMYDEIQTLKKRIEILEGG